MKISKSRAHEQEITYKTKLPAKRCEHAEKSVTTTVAHQPSSDQGTVSIQWLRRQGQLDTQES